MCECYTIGGPWIAEDPECPEHGYEAQRLRLEREVREDRVQEAHDILTDIHAGMTPSPVRDRLARAMLLLQN